MVSPCIMKQGKGYHMPIYAVREMPLHFARGSAVQIRIVKTFDRIDRAEEFAKWWRGIVKRDVRDYAGTPAIVEVVKL